MHCVEYRIGVSEYSSETRKAGWWYSSGDDPRVVCIVYDDIASPACVPWRVCGYFPAIVLHVWSGQINGVLEESLNAARSVSEGKRVVGTLPRLLLGARWRHCATFFFFFVFFCLLFSAGYYDRVYLRFPSAFFGEIFETDMDVDSDDENRSKYIRSYDIYVKWRSLQNTPLNEKIKWRGLVRLRSTILPAGCYHGSEFPASCFPGRCSCLLSWEQLKRVECPDLSSGGFTDKDVLPPPPLLLVHSSRRAFAGVDASWIYPNITSGYNWISIWYLYLACCVIYRGLFTRRRRAMFEGESLVCMWLCVCTVPGTVGSNTSLLCRVSLLGIIADERHILLLRMVPRIATLHRTSSFN